MKRFNFDDAILNLDIEKKKNGLDLSCDPGPGSDLGFSFSRQTRCANIWFCIFPEKHIRTDPFEVTILTDFYFQPKVD